MLFAIFSASLSEILSFHSVQLFMALISIDVPTRIFWPPVQGQAAHIRMWPTELRLQALTPAY
jgi:hypothetical protein